MNAKYLAQIRAQRTTDGDKAVWLPAEPEPVVMGMHGAVADHYGLGNERKSHATTIDYVVASAAACLMGTFGRALQARGVDLASAGLELDATGHVVEDGGVLVLKRIEVRYRLDAPADQRDAIERAHAVHHRACPVSRSLEGSIEIETEVDIVCASAGGTRSP